MTSSSRSQAQKVFLLKFLVKIFRGKAQFRRAILSQDSAYFIFIFQRKGSASVAQLDARPTGDQEVACLTPAGSSTLFHGH